MSHGRIIGAAAACVVAACASVPPPPAAPSSVPWGAPRPFAALYRLDCRGQRNLLATARGDGARLGLTVAAGPAGSVLDAWLEADGGWLRGGGRRCADALPPGTLPLADGVVVPLDPWLAALALSGLVPREAMPSQRFPGWLAAERGGHLVRWLVAGRTVAQLEVLRGESGGSLISLAMSDHHGIVPGRVAFKAGGEGGELRLVEWQAAPPPEPPGWTQGPPCEPSP